MASTPPRGLHDGLAARAMTRRLVLTAALLGAAVLWATQAAAQATVDLHALDQLNGATTPAPPATQQPAQRAPTPGHHHPAHKETHPTAAQAHKHATPPAPATPTAATPSAPVPPNQPHPPAPAAAPPPAATLPIAPPPVVRLAPLDQGTPPPAPPPNAQQTPPVVAADAGGGPEPLPGGVRIMFGPSRADLSPASAAALQSLAEKAAKDDNATFNVMAYAAGPADDPSTPRRLSLSRALAVRTVLMGSAIPSTHIYVRALGSAAGDAPADRADVTLSGPNGAPPSATGASR